MRKDMLINGMVYHIFSRSIAGFSIFNNDSEFLRMVQVIRYYQREGLLMKFSQFIKLPKAELDDAKMNISFSDKENLVEVIAYCIMPTHIHLILKQLRENGVSIFMSNILNSYTRYFNIKHKRKGPLWEGRFRNVLVHTDEQLLHLTRYVHLNPVTAYLADRPEEWLASSYREYLLEADDSDRFCKYKETINIEPCLYRKFTEDRICYQKELAKIKKLIIE